MANNVRRSVSTPSGGRLGIAYPLRRPSASLTETPGRRYYVYVLIDPRDGVTKYVGCSRSAVNRFDWHIVAAKARNGNNPEKDAWLRRLCVVGLEPILSVVATLGSRTEALRLERAMIRLMSQYAPLYNIHHA